MPETPQTRLAPVVVTRVKVNAEIVTPAASASAEDTLAAVKKHQEQLDALAAAFNPVGISWESTQAHITRRHVPVEAEKAEAEAEKAEATPATWPGEMVADHPPADDAGGDGSDG